MTSRTVRHFYGTQPDAQRGTIVCPRLSSAWRRWRRLSERSSWLSHVRGVENACIRIGWSLRRVDERPRRFVVRGRCCRRTLSALRGPRACALTCSRCSRRITVSTLVCVAIDPNGPLRIGIEHRSIQALPKPSLQPAHLWPTRLALALLRPARPRRGGSSARAKMRTQPVTRNGSTVKSVKAKPNVPLPQPDGSLNMGGPFGRPNATPQSNTPTLAQWCRRREAAAQSWPSPGGRARRAPRLGPFGWTVAAWISDSVAKLVAPSSHLEGLAAGPQQAAHGASATEPYSFTFSSLDATRPLLTRFFRHSTTLPIPGIASVRALRARSVSFRWEHLRKRGKAMY